MHSSSMDQSLIQSILSENETEALQLLQSDPQLIQTKNSYSHSTPLHLAITFRNTNVIDAILRAQKSEINRNFTIFAQQDVDGCTPLMLAIERNALGMFDKLMQQADLDSMQVRDIRKDSLMHAAIGYKREWAIRYMLENSILLIEQDSDNATPLMLLAKKGYIEFVEKLLIKLLEHLNAEDDFGFSFHNHINMQDRKGQTALLYAIQCTHPDSRISVCRTLLENGANPNRGNLGSFPDLYYQLPAYLHSQDDIILYGYFREFRKINDITPLVAAILQKDMQLLQLLDKYSAFSNDLGLICAWKSMIDTCGNYYSASILNFVIKKYILDTTIMVLCELHQDRSSYLSRVSRDIIWCLVPYIRENHLNSDALSCILNHMKRVMQLDDIPHSKTPPDDNRGKIKTANDFYHRVVGYFDRVLRGEIRLFRR